MYFLTLQEPIFFFFLVKESMKTQALRFKDIEAYGMVEYTGI